MEKINKLSLEDVIKQRLNLQSTQRILESFGIDRPSLNEIMSSEFLDTFFSWPPEKQKDFVFHLGGKQNIKKTFEFLNSFRTAAIK